MDSDIPGFYIRYTSFFGVIINPLFMKTNYNKNVVEEFVKTVD